jgi:hypothetical protein
MDSDSLSDIQFTKDYGLNTKQIYVQMKTIWPIGARDVLMNMQIVEYDGKAWIVNNSVEDDAIPETSKQLRVQMPLVIFFFKPNPTINGYTVIIISEFNFGGHIPNSLVGPASIKSAVGSWTKC